jgi:enoyl-CoA hydratase
MLVEIEAKDSVRIIRMNHADENRFNGPFVDALFKALDEIEAEPGARSAVFTGAHEKYFSNGLDLNWLLTQPAEGWADFLVLFDRFLHRAFTYKKPTVAAMNGHSFAGGLFLAFCCDWRVMRDDRGWCCIPEVDLGLDLPPGNVALISYVLGTRKTDILALTAGRLTSQEALAAGMIDEVAKVDEVLDKAIEKARQLSAKNPQNYATIKKSLRAGPARVLFEQDPPFIRSLVKEKQGAN